MDKARPTYLSCNGPFLIFAVVALIFTGLKIFGVIAWSWFWILSPIWIFFALIFAVFALIVVAKIVVEVFNL